MLRPRSVCNLKQMDEPAEAVPEMRTEENETMTTPARYTISHISDLLAVPEHDRDEVFANLRQAIEITSPILSLAQAFGDKTPAHIALPSVTVTCDGKNNATVTVRSVEE